MRTGVFKYDHVVHHTVLLYWQKLFKYATIDHFQYIIYSYLTPKLGGIKQKKCIIHYWASRWYLLFYSPKPHNQAWILICRTCIFLKTEKKIPFFKSIRIRVDKVLNYLQVSWESTGVCMLFLKLSSNFWDYINFFIAMVLRQTVQPWFCYK